MALMNERCLELKKSKPTKKEEDEDGQVKKTKKTAKCTYYGVQKIKDYTTHILNNIQDMESLVTDATASQTCPYYATRRAVPAGKGKLQTAGRGKLQKET